LKYLEDGILMKAMLLAITAPGNIKFDKHCTPDTLYHSHIHGKLIYIESISVKQAIEQYSHVKIMLKCYEE